MLLTLLLPEMLLSKVLADRIEDISKKVENLTVWGSPPSNNIVINTCQPGSSLQKHDSFTQTDGLQASDEDTNIEQQSQTQPSL